MQIALIVLLVIAAALVSVLHHRRQMALQQLADQALRDPLTGLPNRILFQSRLDASLTPGSMPPGGVALLFCDLDGFKQVNDGYGHAAGDELLIAVGERLRSCVRETDWWRGWAATSSPSSWTAAPTPLRRPSSGHRRWPAGSPSASPSPWRSASAGRPCGSA